MSIGYCDRSKIEDIATTIRNFLDTSTKYTLSELNSIMKSTLDGLSIIKLDFKNYANTDYTTVDVSNVIAMTMDSFVVPKYNNTWQNSVKHFYFGDFKYSYNRVTSLSKLFFYYKALIDIENVNKLDFSNVTTIDQMFCHCDALVAFVDSNGVQTRPKFSIPKVTSMIYCFDSTKLDYLPITYAPKAVTITGAFTAMPNLTTADFEAPLATTANGLFYDCSGLQTVNVTLPKVENVGGMFAGCTSLTSLTVDFPYATTWYDKVWELDNYQGFCEGCTSLVSFSTPSEKTEYAYTGTLERMFYNCSKLVTADLSQINKWYGDYMTYASDASDYTDMFTGCTSLTTLTLAQDFGGFEYRGSSYATTVKPTLDLSSCPLTHDSCLDVFNKLGTRSNKNSTGTAYNSYVTGTLKLKATTYNLMTADEIAIATAKNWTVTSA